MKISKAQSVLEKVLILYLALWTVSPPLQIDTIFRLAALGSVCVLLLLQGDKILQLERIQLFSLIFVLLVIVVTYFLTGRLSKLLSPIALYLLAISFILEGVIGDRWIDFKSIIPIILIALIIWNFKSASQLAIDPSIARRLVRDDDSVNALMKQGIGGYGLVYPQVCVFPAIAAWTWQTFRRNRLYFAIGAVWVFSYFSFVFASGYSIAAAATVIGIVIFLFYKRRNATLAIVISALLVVGLVWAIGYSDGIRNFLLNMFDGTKVASKINDIYTSITTENTADSIFVRIKAYKKSIGVIFKYPIIGSLWESGIGAHSQILDMFAQYGIFGGYMFVRMFFNAPTKYKKRNTDHFIVSAANASFISMLFVSLLDTVPYQIVFLTTIILPIIFRTLEEWRGVHENSLDGESDTE